MGAPSREPPRGSPDRRRGWRWGLLLPWQSLCWASPPGTGSRGSSDLCPGGQETGAWYRRRSEARGGHQRLSLRVPVTLVQTVPRCGQGLSTPSPGANSTPHVKTPCRFLQGLCPLPEMRRCVSNFCFFKTGTSHVKPCPSPVWSSRCFSKMLSGGGEAGRVQRSHRF